jgi:hypothetical protein
MSSRKLTLARTTLRRLSAEALAQAAGGLTALDCFSPVASERRSNCLRTCDTVYQCTLTCVVDVCNYTVKPCRPL